MSVTGYFGKPSRGFETRWERDARRDMLRDSGKGLRSWSEPGRLTPPLESYARSEDYDPVLRAHCRLDLK
jgi:hypothetical protein